MTYHHCQLLQLHLLQPLNLLLQPLNLRSSPLRRFNSRSSPHLPRLPILQQNNNLPAEVRKGSIGQQVSRNGPDSHPSATWQRLGQNCSTFLTDDALVHHLCARSTSEHVIWTFRLICTLICTKFASNSRLCLKAGEFWRFGLSLRIKLSGTEWVLTMKSRLLPESFQYVFLLWLRRHDSPHELVLFLTRVLGQLQVLCLGRWHAFSWSV